MYAWGRGAEGQTGLGFKSTKAQALATNQGSVLSPHFVHGLLKVPIVRIAAGFSFSAAVARDGRVYTWGEGGLGQLGVGRMTQSAIPVLCLEKDEDGNGFVDIACGWGHTMALSRELQLCCSQHEIGDTIRVKQGKERYMLGALMQKASWA